MKYIILETQTTKDGAVGTLINAYDSKNEAESKYHTVLAAAAISALKKHCAFMLNDSAQVIKSECYEHESEAE